LNAGRSVTSLDPDTPSSGTNLSTAAAVNDQLALLVVGGLYNVETRMYAYVVCVCLLLR
jgi:hypothetical protein